MFFHRVRVYMTWRGSFLLHSSAWYERCKSYRGTLWATVFSLPSWFPWPILFMFRYYLPLSAQPSYEPSLDYGHSLVRYCKHILNFWSFQDFCNGRSSQYFRYLYRPETREWKWTYQQYLKHSCRNQEFKNVVELGTTNRVDFFRFLRKSL